MKRRKGLLDEEKFLPPLPEQLPRGVSSLPGYGQTSPIAQGLLGFTGRQPTYSVMDPEAQKMSEAYRLGEQASVASQLYGSVAPFAVASTMANAARIPGAGAQIFIGKKSPAWNAQAEIAFNKLEAQGLPKEEIWRQTGTFRGSDKQLRQEISDDLAQLNWQEFLSTAKSGEPEKVLRARLGSYLEHPELFKAYPDLAQAKLRLEENPAYSGSYYRPGQLTKEDVFKTGGSASRYEGDEQLAKARSTLLHEIQHGIQYREDFAGGGNPEAIPQIIASVFQPKMSLLEDDVMRFERAIRERSAAQQADYFHWLESMEKKQNIKPSSIFNLSDWYEYSGEITSKLGKMPSKKGSGRDEWLRSAASIIKEKNIERYPQLENIASSTSPEEAKSILRKTKKKIEEYGPSYKEQQQLIDEQKNLVARPFESYRKLAGEAESRAVQARESMTPAQRREVFPMSSYDIPEEQLIVFKQLGLLD